MKRFLVLLICSLIFNGAWAASGSAKKNVNVHQDPAALAPSRASLDAAPRPGSASSRGHRGPSAKAVDGDLPGRKRLQKNQGKTQTAPVTGGKKSRQKQAEPKPAASLAWVSFKQQAQSLIAALRVERDEARAVVKLAELEALRPWLEDPAGIDALYLDLVAKKNVPAGLKDRLRLYLARYFRRQAQDDEAIKQLDQTGRIHEILWLASFANTGGQGFVDPPLDAEAIEVALGSGPELIEKDPRHWQVLRNQGVDPFFDFSAHLDSSDERMTYVLFNVVSDKAQRVALHWGNSDQICLRVGAEQERCFDEKHPWAFSQRTVGLDLAAGSNPVLLRLGNLDGAFRLSLRLSLVNGRPLASGVTANAQLAAGPLLLKTYKTRFARVDDALTLLQRRAKTGSDQARAEALSQLAWLQAAWNLYDARVEPNTVAVNLRSALDLRPNDPALWQRYAQALAIYDRDGARRASQRSLALQPDWVPSLVALGQHRLRQERFAEAQVTLNRAFALEPRSPPVVLARVDSLVGPDGDEDDPVRALHEAVKNCAPTGGEGRCEALVRRWRSHLLGIHDVQEELRWAQRGLDANAMDSSAVWSLLRVAKRAADVTKALALQRRLNALAPQAVDGQLRLARLMLYNGQPTKAVALVKDLSTRFPRRADVWVLRGEAALEVEDKGSAVEAWRQALLIRPQQPELQRRLENLGAKDATEAVALLPDLDIDALRAMPTPETAKPFGVYVLARQLAVQVYPNGLYRTVEEQAIRLVDANFADRLRRHFASYAPDREEVTVLVAERISADGRASPPRSIADRGPRGRSQGAYSDRRAKVIDFAQLEVGDIIHIKTRTDAVGESNLFGDFFGRIDLAQGFWPQGRYDFVVESPIDHPLAYFTRGVSSAESTSPHDPKLRRYLFSARDLPGLRPEANMPAPFDLLPYVSISSYRDWNAMSAWYAKLIDSQYALDDQTIAVAQKLVNGVPADDVHERVRRVYNYVIKKTRYVGIELGVHGWKPYRASLVHRRGYGDCKDKATLLVSMLAAVGVPAELVLLRTSHHGQLDPVPATMWAFNHAIAYVPGLDLFLDGTAEFSGMHELPSGDQGAMALRVTRAGTSQLVSPPVAPAKANNNRSNYQIVVDSSGDFELHGEERFSGAFNASLRRRYADRARQKELLEQELSAGLAGVQLTSLDFSPVDDVDKDVWYRFVAQVPGRAKVVKDGLELPLSLYPQDLVKSYAANDERLYDVVVRNPWRGENRMRYILPAGFALPDLPKDLRIDNPHLLFKQSFERFDDGFAVVETTVLRSKKIPVKDYAAFRQACLKADAAMQRRLLLQRGAGSRP